MPANKILNVTLSRLFCKKNRVPTTCIGFFPDKDIKFFHPVNVSVYSRAYKQIEFDGFVRSYEQIPTG